MFKVHTLKNIDFYRKIGETTEICSLLFEAVHKKHSIYSSGIVDIFQISYRLDELIGFSM